jgi:hypothetical protein
MSCVGEEYRAPTNFSSRVSFCAKFLKLIPLHGVGGRRTKATVSFRISPDQICRAALRGPVFDYQTAANLSLLFAIKVAHCL